MTETYTRDSDGKKFKEKSAPLQIFRNEQMVASIFSIELEPIDENSMPELEPGDWYCTSEDVYIVESDYEVQVALKQYDPDLIIEIRKKDGRVLIRNGDTWETKK